VKQTPKYNPSMPANVIRLSSAGTQQAEIHCAMRGKNGTIRHNVVSAMSELKEQTIRVAIVEDDEDVRDMLERVFKATEGFELAGSWPDMETALRFIKLNRPNVMLLDIGLPGMSGLEGAGQVLKTVPNVKILMLTGRNAKEDVFKALRAGASGYITKGSSQAEILQSVRAVAEGNAALSPDIARTVVDVFRPSNQQYDLTRRELEILAQLCNGAVY
jgi:DNA-binding NarL/FixJ family response regulator